MTETQLQREIILDSLRSFPHKGVEFILRVLPPPQIGWWIEVNETNLQEFSDSKREGVLLALVELRDRLESLGISVGIIRAAAPGVHVPGDGV